jgi:cysteine-rich repeat protein
VPDGAACSFAGVNGFCRGGGCFSETCGDRVVIGAEQCDDGNNVSGDGCSADCLSTEVCNNGVVDPGEQCDCGDGSFLPDGCSASNSDIAGATCRSDCVLHCGDGIVNALEQCDSAPPTGSCVQSGFDQGRLACADNCTASRAGCRHLNWQTSSIGAEGLTYSLWADGNGVVFSSTSGNSLARFDGLNWKLWPVDGTILSVSGTAADNVYAFGYTTPTSGAVWHFDGIEVSRETLPPDTPVVGFSWATSADNIIAITGSGLLRFDGSTWTMHSPPIDYSIAYSIWISPEPGNPIGSVHLGMENGSIHVSNNLTTWSESKPPGGAPITGLWGTAADDIYALQDDSVLRNTGGGWATEYSADRRLVAIHGRSDGHVTVAGANLALHSDGVRWLEDRDLPAAASAPKRLWVQEDGRTFMVGGDLFFFGGDRVLPTSLVSGSNALWGAAPDDVFAITANDRVAHFDGASWTEDQTFSVNKAGALWGSSRTDLWAGFGADVYRFDGDAWSPAIPHPQTSGLTMGHSVSPTDVIVGDSPFTVKVLSDGSWASTTMQSVVTAVAGWQHGDEVEYLAAGRGMLRHYVGTAWTDAEAPIHPLVWLRGIWGASGGVWVVGDFGTTLFYDGDQWFDRSFTTSHLVSVAGLGPSDIFASRSDGNVFLHFDGASWSPVRLNNKNVASVSVFPGGAALGRRDNGIVPGFVDVLYRTNDW